MKGIMKLSDHNIKVKIYRKQYNLPQNLAANRQRGVEACLFTSAQAPSLTVSGGLLQSRGFMSYQFGPDALEASTVSEN